MASIDSLVVMASKLKPAYLEAALYSISTIYQKQMNAQEAKQEQRKTSFPILSTYRRTTFDLKATRRKRLTNGIIKVVDIDSKLITDYQNTTPGANIIRISSRGAREALKREHYQAAAAKRKACRSIPKPADMTKDGIDRSLFPQLL